MIAGGASGHVGVAAALMLALDCDRPAGCVRSERPMVSSHAAVSGSVIDCPDGLGRCSDGIVEVSRLAAIALPCVTPEKSCACPWEVVGACPGACAAEAVEVVIDRGVAMTQLCAPVRRSEGTLTVAVARPAAPERCEESQLYRCAGRNVIDCGAGRIAASCRHGCFAEGAFIGDERLVEREAAFAILCSR